MKILFASQNKGKQREFARLLDDYSVELIFPQDLDSSKLLDVPETGESFIENALIKARAFAKASNLPSIADDSGLTVGALDGFPGVRSDRFVDDPEADRQLAILELLKDKKNRSAQFHSVLAFVDPKKGTEKIFEGLVNGSIANKKRGDDGFAYDYIFIPEGFEQTWAELGMEKKNTMSPRKQAIEKFLTYFL